MTEKWSVVEIDDLITLVRENREIYDPSCAGYSNLYTTDALWRQISDHFPCRSEQELRKKWQILRTGYRSRRGEKYLSSGSGTKPIKKWAYFDALMFLEPYMTERSSATNTVQKSNGTTMSSCNGAVFSSSQHIVKPFLDVGKIEGCIKDDSNIELSDGEDEEDTEAYDYKIMNTHMEREEFSPAISDAPSTPRSGSSKTSNKGRKRKMFIEYLERKQEVPKKEMSSNEFFLASLLEDMNKLSSDSLRIFKISILNKLGELLDT